MSSIPARKHVRAKSAWVMAAHPVSIASLIALSQAANSQLTYNDDLGEEDY